jgi:hypothetical protein
MNFMIYMRELIFNFINLLVILSINCTPSNYDGPVEIKYLFYGLGSFGIITCLLVIIWLIYYFKKLRNQKVYLQFYLFLSITYYLLIIINISGQTSNY